ncbi:DUF3718 domain-containing protein [Pseudoalteromonas mariniglutinosa]|uniref:DUF3718 domain-containing protein n=1 Tax=Pseudoalteromonas mariniglutinosa TaxID=206042 RepID=UPI00384CD1B1
MNTLTTMLTTGILATTIHTADAKATQFVAADTQPGTQACIAITSNRPLDVAQTMRTLRLSKRVMINKLQCNDMSSAQFARTYGFNKVANYLSIDATTSTSIHDIAQTNPDHVLVVAGSK